MLNCLSEYGTSINKEQGYPFTTSNLKCLGDQTQSLCKLLQVNNQYLLGRLQWPQYHREPWSTKQYAVKQAPSLLQETFLCLCGKKSPSELSPQRREAEGGALSIPEKPHYWMSPELHLASHSDSGGTANDKPCQVRYLSSHGMRPLQSNHLSGCHINGDKKSQNGKAIIEGGAAIETVIKNCCKALLSIMFRMAWITCQLPNEVLTSLSLRGATFWAAFQSASLCKSHS